MTEKMGICIIKYTYAKYANMLREATKQIGGNFYYDIINRYCDFIELFAEHINDCLSKIEFKEDENWNILTSYKEFNKIRCHDIWQKLVMHKCGKYLSYKIGKKYKIDFNSSDKYIHNDTDDGKDRREKIYIGIGFLHGEAYLEYKYRLSDKDIFCIQQQGKHPLSVGVVVFKREKTDEEWNKEKGKKADNILLIKDFKLNSPKGKKYYSYKNSNSIYIYYLLTDKEHKNQNCKYSEYSICDTLDIMINLMDKVINATKNSNINNL